MKNVDKIYTISAENIDIFYGERSIVTDMFEVVEIYIPLMVGI